jgi:hypothetical protein
MCSSRVLARRSPLSPPMRADRAVALDARLRWSSQPEMAAGSPA